VIFSFNLLPDDDILQHKPGLSNLSVQTSGA